MSVFSAGCPVWEGQELLCLNPAGGEAPWGVGGGEDRKEKKEIYSDEKRKRIIVMAIYECL